MSRQDAESTKRHLDQASDKSKRLRDPELTKKIDEASKHIEKKLDPQQG